MVDFDPKSISSSPIDKSSVQGDYKKHQGPVSNQGRDYQILDNVSPQGLQKQGEAVKGVAQRQFQRAAATRDLVRMSPNEEDLAPKPNALAQRAVVIEGPAVQHESLQPAMEEVLVSEKAFLSHITRFLDQLPQTEAEITAFVEKFPGHEQEIRDFIARAKEVLIPIKEFSEDLVGKLEEAQGDPEQFAKVMSKISLAPYQQADKISEEFRAFKSSMQPDFARFEKSFELNQQTIESITIMPAQRCMRYGTLMVPVAKFSDRSGNLSAETKSAIQTAHHHAKNEAWKLELSVNYLSEPIPLDAASSLALIRKGNEVLSEGRKRGLRETIAPIQQKQEKVIQAAREHLKALQGKLLKSHDTKELIEQLQTQIAAYDATNQGTLNLHTDDLQT